MGSLNLSVLNSTAALELLTGQMAPAPGLSSSTLQASSLAASAPSPPWLQSSSGASARPNAFGASSTTIPPQASALMQSLLAGGKLINPSAAKLSASGTDANAAANYRNLFALYQGLSGLQSIAKAATAKNLTAQQVQQLQQAFQAGLGQLQAYLGSEPFKGFQVYQTAPEASASSTTATPIATDTYTTQPLYEGAPNGVVPGFQGTVQFSLTATKASGAQVTVNFDFSQLGTQARTFGNVLTYMNAQMAAAGLTTRFAESFTPGKATTEKIGSQTITLPAGPDQYALKIEGTSAETLTFSAPASDPGVYVAQSSGITTGTKPDAVQQLLKLDGSSTPADPSAVNNQVFTQTLGSSVSKAVATASAPDGSVYVLENLTGPVNGQSIQGAQDVALVKYDSAGNVVFTRTLGAPDSATGYGLAVSADGSQVAVVGSTTDNLDPTAVASSTVPGSAAKPPPQGFLTVYDASGNEQWTQQTQAIGGSGGGVQPGSVAFGSNGMVYVAGQVDGDIPGGGGSSGGLDAYVQAFKATSVPVSPGSSQSQWVVTPTAAVQYGTSGQDHAAGIAVSGSTIYVAGSENGQAVVRSFTASGTTGEGLTPAAVRNLGALDGGNVAGVAVETNGSVVVAGSTHNGALSAGTVNQAYTGGEEAFVANLSASLQASASDALTYLGGSADQTASAITVSGGQVYVAGQIATTPMAGTGVTSAWNGYVAALDPATGAVSWSQQYQGQENEAAPAGIAVTGGGASVLDQLGLPGTIDYSPSQQLVAASSLRPGDKFYVQSGTGAPAAVIIAAGDTYQSLAQKIQQASNYTVKAVVLPGTGGDILKLTPAYQGEQVSLLPGPAGRDALGPLGLSQGVLTSAASKEGSAAPISTSGPAIQHDSLKNGYSLRLASSLSLSNPARATAAEAALAGAIATIKGVYADMITPPSAAKATGSTKVPTYLTNEIANYQAALRRLTGG